MKINHIGYLVKNVEKAQKRFLKLGFGVDEGPIFDSDRMIDITFMSKDGYSIELVAPKSEESVVYDLYKKYRNTPYHICYETNNFDEDLNDLVNDGFVQIDEPRKAVAFNNKRIVFLMNATIGMIELVEK